MPQVLDQILQFRAGQRVVGLDGVAADGLGDDVFAQTQGVDACPAALSSSTNSKMNRRGWLPLTKGRQRVQQKGPLAKFAQADAQPGQRGQLFAQELRVARGQFDGFRQKQRCEGAAPLFFQPPQHLLEKNALVRGVLVQENQAAIGFEHDIEAANDPTNATALAASADGCGAGGRWAGG
jgi:hypothetical protein